MRDRISINLDDDRVRLLGSNVIKRENCPNGIVLSDDFDSKTNKGMLFFVEDGILNYAKRMTGSLKVQRFECADPLRQILNELIGMYYSKKIERDVVDLKLAATDKKDIYLASEEFKEKGHLYLFPNEVYKINTRTGIHQIANHDNDLFHYTEINKYNSSELLRDILGLTAVDINMMQTDRGEVNTLLKLKYFEEMIRLGKSHDFEFAYGLHVGDVDVYDTDRICSYGNPFIQVAVTPEGIYKLLNQFPEGHEVFKTVAETDIDEIFSLIETNYPITIGDHVKTEYRTKDSSVSKIIKKAL